MTTMVTGTQNTKITNTVRPDVIVEAFEASLAEEAHAQQKAEQKEVSDFQFVSNFKSVSSVLNNIDEKDNKENLNGISPSIEENRNG
jgi:hypothetical protein